MKEFLSLNKSILQIRKALADSIPGSCLNQLLQKRLIVLEEQSNLAAAGVIATWNLMGLQ